MLLFILLIYLSCSFQKCVLGERSKFSYDLIDKKAALADSTGTDLSGFRDDILPLLELVTSATEIFVNDPKGLLYDANAGDPKSQFLVGMLYTMGPDDHLVIQLPQDEALSRLYLELSAKQNYTYALLALGYRYTTGIGTPKQVDKGLSYYRQVSEQVTSLVQPLTHFARNMAKDYPVDVYDLNGRQSSDSNILHIRDDMLEFLKDFAVNGNNITAHLNLAAVYHRGQLGKARNPALAMKHYLSALRLAYPGISEVSEKAISQIYETNKNGFPKPTMKNVGSIASTAFNIGCMELHGDIGKRNPTAAFNWFEFGKSLNHTSSRSALAYLYYMNYQVPIDETQAKQLLNEALSQNDPIACTIKGKLAISENKTEEALSYFQIAFEGSHLEAALYLAYIYSDINQEKAILLHEHFISRTLQMYFDFRALSMDTKVKYFFTRLSAELGNLMSQVLAGKNADPSKSFLKNAIVPYTNTTYREAQIALTYYSRAAVRHHLDSMIKVADFNQFGLGTPKNPGLAFALYTQAGTIGHSSLAYWRLGEMHEYGNGVPVDFEMAKKNYDISLELNYRGLLAILLARLRMKLSHPDTKFSVIYYATRSIVVGVLKSSQKLILFFNSIFSRKERNSDLLDTSFLQSVPSKSDGSEPMNPEIPSATPSSGIASESIAVDMDSLDRKFVETLSVTLLVVIVGYVLMKRHQQSRRSQVHFGNQIQSEHVNQSSSDDAVNG
ncbi:Hrd1 ubiquitin ligase complex SEL1/TPR repeat subunit [Schizosaccharomyces osmophilus]|uniref:Hrd1 ubiquitin ligase complex SEL1/TPR repeat subunit n=1 Tax=Schizosaccharomyces osmophilus TaxID=2545709 RepID=A0AAF0AU77_9SCHI|nr:Hrd1 ubiquitin ligase complex SEL1/TPR repeat subunit [Schizosaccharomyces osmophilus]WBW71073.1 Hrd1 ubiquitin ligase complex SEL1/TPR repeat subunit [Schizosaccharomyces osmophilus]